MIYILVLIVNMVEEAFFIQKQDAVLLKKELAKKLYGKNIDQIKIAEILDLSQPMVSNYLKSEEKIPAFIKKTANEISEKISKDSLIIFQTSIVFSKKNIQGNYFIADKTELISEEKNKVIHNLSEAFQKLKGNQISKILPEVKVNIAMSKTSANNTDDVASFLNGLVIADDKIIGNNGIRFGKSKHLSSLLLKLQNDFQINAIMNIANNKNFEKTNLNISNFTKDFKYNTKQKNVDIFVHPGDFGIEPCAYVLGVDAIDVSNKILKIIKEV